MHFGSSGRFFLSAASLVLLVAPPAHSDSLNRIFTVSAIDHSIHPPSRNGAPLATGIFLGKGDSFVIIADPEGRWGNQSGHSYDAAGSDRHVNWDLGGERRASIGTLLASVGPWNFFPVGLIWTGTAETSGELFLGFFDAADAGYDNSGAISVIVSYGEDQSMLSRPAPPLRGAL